MIETVSPLKVEENVGRASERKILSMQLESVVGVSRSNYESLPVQNSVESMDMNNLGAIINRTECQEENDEASQNVA